MSSFPIIHFYDQDFVDVYNRSWLWIEKSWQNGTKKNGFPHKYFVHAGQEAVNQFEAILSTFFLVYSNNTYPAAAQLDLFYDKQENSGAIRGDYSIHDGSFVASSENPDGLNPPLFSWAEYNLYHKIGNKKRILDILQKLERYYEWLEENFRDKTGLYVTPVAATTMKNSPRGSAKYLIDFNSQQAINAYYIAELADIVNEKTVIFRYRKRYFGLKALINKLMWNNVDGVYYDLDENLKQTDVKTIATFWPLLTQMPDSSSAEALIGHLKNPKTFGSEYPLPSLAMSEPLFSNPGTGYRGSVFPHLNFMVFAGLTKYNQHTLAREYAIKHLYCIIDGLTSEDKQGYDVWEAYKPTKNRHATWQGKATFPRKFFMPYIGLATITTLIEIIIGLDISLPKKTVNWVVPVMEAMGVENLALKRNLITILTSNGKRGWEIKHVSKKLYYFAISVEGKWKRTLPIPSGRCVVLIDKI